MFVVSIPSFFCSQYVSLFLGGLTWFPRDCPKCNILCGVKLGKQPTEAHQGKFLGPWSLGFQVPQPHIMKSLAPEGSDWPTLVATKNLVTKKVVIGL